MTDLIAVTEWAWPLGVLGLLCAYAAYHYLTRQPSGTELTAEAGERIRRGAVAFLRREYSVVAVFLATTATLLGLAIGVMPAVAYAFGALSSMAVGFFGIDGASRASMRTAAAAQQAGPGRALRMAFFGGAVTGLSAASLGLLGLGVLFVAFAAGAIPGTQEFPFFIGMVVSFAAGASSFGLFARIAGGIYAKSVNIGAGLVGRVEGGIPQDDLRNPATIAGHVGENVGRVAGAGADLFASYVAAVAAAMAFAATAPELAEHQAAAVALPLLTVMIGLLASLAGVGTMRVLERLSPLTALRNTTFIAAGLFLVATYFATQGMGITFTDAVSGRAYPTFGPWVAIVAGTLAGIAIGLATEYYTSTSPVRRIGEVSRGGPATNIITGLAVGMESTAVPVILVCVTVGASYFFAGLYGVGMSAVGMLGTIGVTLSVGAYGAVAANAAGIGVIGHLGPDARQVAESLDSVGSTADAKGKGLATGAAALTALALLSAYASAMGLRVTGMDLTDPDVAVGLFLGGALPFLISSVMLSAVTRTAERVAAEVRRQFLQITGLGEGTVGPDSAGCVDFAARAALRETIVPCLIAVVMPVAVGYFLGVEALGGMLAGAAVTGVLMALFMAHAGGALDHARRYIEGGALGGKGSDPHKAAVVGETVGDSLGDAAGPSLSAVVRFAGVVSLALAPWLARVHGMTLVETAARLLRAVDAVRAFLG